VRFIGLDPSTKTGFVALNEYGQVLKAKELTGVGSEDPVRMITMIDEIAAHIQKEDIIVIEGFGFATQQGIQLGGIGWGIRMALARRGFKYIEVSPSQVKKFATGKGNTKKEDMILPLFKHWGFENSSDNVRDAYILAQIAKGLKTFDTKILTNEFTNYQLEVLAAINNPPVKKKKTKQKTIKGS